MGNLLDFKSYRSSGKFLLISASEKNFGQQQKSARGGMQVCKI
jgi:hypothetical protein